MHFYFKRHPGLSGLDRLWRALRGRIKDNVDFRSWPLVDPSMLLFVSLNIVTRCEKGRGVHLAFSPNNGSALYT
jgi:hypothetical protein